MKIVKRHQSSGHNAAIYALQNGLSRGSFMSAAGDGWIVEWPLHQPDLGRLVAKADAQLFSLHTLPVEQTIVAGDMNGGVHWLYLDEGRPNRHIAHHQKGVYCILSRSGFVFTLGGDGILTKWRTERPAAVESLRLSNQALRSACWWPESSLLLIGASDQHIYLVDTDTMQLVRTFHRHIKAQFSALLLILRNPVFGSVVGAMLVCVFGTD
ncbi:MAG: hypothetical protein R2795_02840 [Saprospiraceae bacterium]